MSETMTDVVKRACDIATGRVEADPGAAGKSIRGGHKDLSCSGKGPHWYRMVWRGGSWRYVSDQRLPQGKFRAAERRCSVYGMVYPGEIVVGHDYASPVDCAWLAVSPGEDGNTLVPITYNRRRDGKLAFALPDGSEVVLENPRR